MGLDQGDTMFVFSYDRKVVKKIIYMCIFFYKNFVKIFANVKYNKLIS